MYKRLLFVMLLIFSACKEKSFSIEENIGKSKKTGIWTYNINNTEQVINWKVFDSLANFKINYPKQWEVQSINDNKEAEIFKAVNNDKELFVVMRYNIEIIDLKSYVKRVSQILLESKDEEYKMYSLERVTFEDKNAYYMKLSSSKKGKDYIIYTVYTENKGYVYDFTFRTLDSNDENNELNYLIYIDVVNSTYIPPHKLFKEEEYVIESKIITLEEL